ncbi:MAG: M20/M25/M40 family metallo-hydrolase, partial [Bacteroidales bacterium]|nr:M20/M25/M40 family metallo-hydrolase [Bacteroidales bacterium]
MKKVILSTALFFLLLSGAAAQERNREQSTDSTLINALGQVRSDSLLSYVQTLQDFGTRFMIAPNRKEIATWIMDKFISFGLTEVRLDSFACYTYVNAPPYIVFDTTTWQYNVEAKITGSVNPACEIVMMGHYDDCVPDSDPLALTPGADDNASGVAALLESARVIMETGHQPRQTFIFLATAAEELMYVSDCGSRHYAQEAASEGRDLSMVINNDMISWNDSSWTILLNNDINSQRITELAIHV